MKSNLIRIMEDAVVKAGRSLVRDFGEVENLQVSKKGPGDFVTSADKKSEKILINELKKLRPSYGFLVEESGEIKGADEKYRWIIDPLDGTNNFMHGLPHFCISLALAEKTPTGKEDIIAAVIYAPAYREIYTAEKGQGAYLGNRRLSVSGRTKLDEAMIATCFKPGSDEKNEMLAIEDMAINTRILGSAALDLTYVAAGKLDIFWHDKLMPWDMAAGILLVREARGMVTEINGDADMLVNGNIVATNSNFHEKIVSTLAKYYDKKR